MKMTKLKKMMKQIFNISTLNKISIAIILTFISVGLKAQNDAISRFFTKYENDPDFTVVNVTGKMFSLFTHFEPQDEEEKAMKEAMSNIEGLKILALDDDNRVSDLYNEAFKLLPKDEYEVLMTIRDDDGDFRFMIKEKGGKINELIMLGKGKMDFFILSLVGDIDLKAISTISRHVDIDGFEHFHKLKEDDDN